MTLIRITRWWDGTTLHEVEATDTRDALQKLVLTGANLRDANLRDANLTGADLTDANLTGANLMDANLTGANLSGADLMDANLTGANLSGADLMDANLTGANLSGADLMDANLTGANLSGADLMDANLTGANLSGADLMDANLTGANLSGADLMDANLMDANLTIIRDDLWAVLSSAPAEVPALLQALANGKVDGSTYSGTCACLVGTIANARGCDVNSLGALKPQSWRPAERFFLGIKPGDTPENSQAAKLAHEWASEWLDRIRTTL